MLTIDRRIRAVTLGGIAVAVMSVVPGMAVGSSTGSSGGVPQIDGHVLVKVAGATISVPIPAALAGQRITKVTAQLRPTQHADNSARYDTVSPETAPASSAGKEAPSSAAQSSGAAPGTITTSAGGSCDGLPARAVTIAPRHVTVTRSGQVLWVDDDDSSVPVGNGFEGSGFGSISGGFSTPFLGMHTRGSYLFRTVAPDGTVRTLGPVLPPEQGTIMRMNFYTQYFTRLVAGPDGSLYTAILHNPFTPITVDPIGDTRIVRLTGDRQTMVVGGEPYQETSAATDPIGYGDNDPVRKTGLGDVESFAFDGHGGLFIAEGGAGAVRIRYANLTHQAVTFYAGTSDAVTVQPGRIRAVAGFSRSKSPSGFPADQATRTVPTDVFDSSFGQVPAMHWRAGVLYLADQRADASVAGFNLQIRAINLGVDGQPARTVLGTVIPNGDIGLLAGADAGSGPTGDGGPALAAGFGVNDEELGDFDLDPHGNLVIADPLANEVRLVDATGPGGVAMIHALAGGPVAGFAGDGGPATAAELNEPVGVAVAGNGDVYVSDYWNARIRRIHQGVISTVAGIGPYPCGAGQPATSSRSYYEGADFGSIRDIAPDYAGGYYVADGAYNTVRHINKAGIVDATIGQPMGCMINDDFQDPHCPLLGNQTLDPGPYAQARFAEPFFLTADTYNNVYISDYDRVRYANLTSHPVSVNGKTVPPRSIVTLAVFPNRTVHVSYAVTGRPTYVGEVPLPLGDLAVDAVGNLYVADLSFNRIYRIDSCGRLSLFAGTGQAPLGATGGGSADYGDGLPIGQANVSPGALAFDRRRNALLVVDGGYPGVTHSMGGLRVRAIDLAARPLSLLGHRILPLHIDSIAGLRTGGAFGDGGPAGEASISGATTIAVAPDGRIYLAESMDARIQVILPDGRIGNLAGPWPDRTPDTPFTTADYYHWGTAGDGRDAQHAWMDVWGKISGYNNYPVAMEFVALDARGRLLFADHTSGRVRAISDVAHAPIRLSGGGSLPLQWPGTVGLTTPIPLPGEADTVAAPTLDSTGSYLVASRGSMLGCDLWARKPTLRMITSPFPFVPDPTGNLPNGVGVAGSSCTIGWTQIAGQRTLYVASLVDTGKIAALNVASTQDGLAVGIATTQNPAAATPVWTTTYVPVPDTSLGPHRPFLIVPGIVSGLTAAVPPPSIGGLTLLYLDAGHTMHTYTSVDGVTVLPVGASSWPLTAGGLTSAAVLHGHLFTGATVTAPTATAGAGPAVAETTDGLSWTFHSVGPADIGPAPADPPSLTTDGDDLIAITNDPPHLQVTNHTVGGGWATQTLSDAPTGYLRTVVSGPRHSLVLAQVVPSRSIRSYDDGTNTWYDETVVLQPRAGRYRATATLGDTRYPVSQGALCVNADCEIKRSPSQDPLHDAEALYDADAWRPSLAIDPVGTLTATFDTQPGPRYFDVLRPVVASSCRSVLGPPRNCDHPGRIVAVSVDDGSSASTLPDQAVPPVPSLLSGCSPRPPAAPGPQQPRPAPARPSQPVPTAHRPAPPAHPAALPPVPAEPPLQPALPPGAAPAVQPGQAQQQANQSAAQPQAGTQIGIAAADEAQAQRARNYAYNRPNTDTYPPVAAAWLAVLGTLTVVYLGRRRRRPAAAFVESRPRGR